MMSGSAIPEGLFCAHKKLKTTCPECRPPPEENPVLQARAEKEKREAERKAARRKTVQPAKREEAGDAAEGEADAAKKQRAKRTIRRRIKPPTREEAEKAEAWWVK